MITHLEKKCYTKNVSPSDPIPHLIPGLVNRKQVIRTLEDKANITGFRWTRPRKIPEGFQEKRGENGDLRHYFKTLPVTILDVDGREKHTTRTTFFEADKRTVKEKPAPFIGRWVEGLAGTYHGRLSANWHQEHLTLSEIVAVLNAGYAFAPGLFNPPSGESHRSGDYCELRQNILFDGDEWGNVQHPVPSNFDQLIEIYPDLPKDFYWIGESISSRSSLKPELRTRPMLVLPEPIRKGETDLWETVIDWVVTKYPFIARGVGIDKVRLSFGNARPECENRILGGLISHETFTEWKQIASEKQAKAEAEKVESKKKKAKAEARRAENNTITNELKRRGHTLTQSKDPLREYCKVNPETLLLENGLASRLSGNTWNWYESSQGRSFELVESPHVGWALKIFSSTMQGSHPESDSTKPVGAHRFILYHLHRLDISNDNDKHALRCILADQGYGTHPDDYREAKAVERETAIREGLVSPETDQSKAKLQRNRESENAPTETLEVNRDQRENATDTFFTTETETLHLLFVGDATGTGKSHTTIAKAQQHKKRTLAQLPHTDLATQAVAIAWEHGYKNPYHLLGRAHNWDDSGIEEIPIEARTRDLFNRNNCIMFDAVQTYTAKRLAPRTYCEHKCAFREGCPHLAQYEGLGQRDFVASCTPNLLFDLNMRGYLQSLVTATDENSVEELAIDAMLGTESEATADFDFAIVDDYGINGLFTDITFSQKEFKAVRKAWNGTPTADFATRLLKAFKKKNPHKIVKALRSAFERTLEFHTDISETLTQHARIGIVEWAERGKSSKESRRLLAEKQVRYEDGGTQFIPVDFEAYKELVKKGIPSVNGYYLETEDIGAEVRIPHTPTHALIDGVSVNDLTPIWQKGATPVELLEIFLSSVGNDKNAPILRTGEPPNADLTFSIPPQAPVGLLPQIAMLIRNNEPSGHTKGF